MTGVDIITLLIISVSGALGYGRGFVRETLALLAWVVAIVATKVFESPATAFLTPHVGTYSGAAVLAFVVIFGVTYLVGRLMAKNIGARTQQSVIGPVDKLLGAAFGSLKGFFMAVVIFLVLVLVIDTWKGSSDERPHWLTRSQFYPALNNSADALVSAVKARQHSHHAPLDNSADASN